VCAKVHALPLWGQQLVDEAQRSSARGERGLRLDPCGDDHQVCSLGAGFKARRDALVEQSGHTLRDLGGQSRVERNLAGVSAGKAQSLRPGGSTSMRSATQACIVHVAVKHPCAEATEAVAALCCGCAALCPPSARR
jgi:hypothetical protein